MDNYTKFVITNQESGEVIADYQPKERTRFYVGPRKYWRIMEMYDKASLLLSSTTGLHLLIFIRTKVDPETYRISLNATHIAEDIQSSRVAVANNIKRLIDGNYIHKEKRGKYFVNPEMFWSQNVSAEKLNELKEDFKEATNA